MLTGVVCIKIAGAICVVSGCVGTGLSISRSYRRRYRQLEMLRQMMLLLKGEIRYARSELPEAFSHVALRVGPPFSEFLAALTDEMKALTGQSFYELWERHIDGELSASCLSGEDRENLKRLGGQLGFLDQAMQLAAIDLYIEGLNTAIADFGQTVPGKQKVSISLGILSGFFLAVLLI